VQERRIEHLRCVDCKAEEYDRQGYSVKANIGGWGKPPTIEGMVPDLRVKRGDQIIIGQVLRKEDLDATDEDYKKFIKYVGKDENTSFRVFTISEDGKPKLHKIY
jgi:hypothetical protein